MNLNLKFAMLFLSILSIALGSTYSVSIENSIAQSDTDSDNNTMDQNGESNKASKVNEKSQDSIQNSMCISGINSLLNCNNLASERSGTLVDYDDNEGHGEQPGSEAQVNQMVFTLNPGERGWDPTSSSGMSIIDLTNLIDLTTGNPIRSDISFQLTWVSEGGENNAETCDVFQYLVERQSAIEIFYGKTPIYNPDEGAILTVVATSSNPLN